MLTRLTTTLALLLTSCAVAGGVVQLEWDGTLDFGALGYLEDAYNDLAGEGLDLVVLRLSSLDGEPYPVRRLGELLDSAPFPTAVWVAPAGSRLAGRALLLGWSADGLYGAPGVHFGNAAVLSLDESGGLNQPAPIEEDCAAGLPAGLDSGWPRLLTSGYVEFTPGQMRARGLADGTAASLEAVIDEMLGGDGGLREIERRETAWLWRGLSYIAEPTTAFLLYLLALFAFGFAVTHRSGYFALALGVGLLISSVITFIYLPVSVLGLVLVPLGVLSISLDRPLRLGGLGGLLGLGSLLAAGLLFYTPDSVGVSSAVLTPTLLVVGVYYLFGYAGAFFNQLLDGGRRLRGLLGRWGRAVRGMDRRRRGWVLLNNELWPARFRKPVKRGQAVQVVDIRRSQLIVTPLVEGGLEQGGLAHED